VIDEIHQFHLHFSHDVFFAHWRFVFRYTAYRVWAVFHVLLGRTLVFGLHTKNLLKTFFNLKRKNLGFPALIQASSTDCSDNS